MMSSENRSTLFGIMLQGWDMLWRQTESEEPMTTSERMKMAAGEWYTCIDDELEALRVIARDAVFEHNSLPPRQRGNIAPALQALLGGAGEGARIEAPFHCAYGFNLFLGERAFLNAGCTILDTAPVRIGKATLLG